MQTIDQIMAEEQRKQDQWEQETIDEESGYTIATLRQAFDGLCDPQDWRGPIAVWMQGEAVSLAVRAIQWFTATTPTVQLNTTTMLYLVTSPGYRQGPAGDH